MIITFSGPDGVGKSTHLMRLSRMFQMQGIDHNILHVRGLATPLTSLYRKLLRKWGRERHAKGWILRIGLALTTVEMIYLWTFRLRVMQKRHQVILCDRYIWDSQVDFTARFRNWKPQSFLWKLLQKTAPEPDASILFTASTADIAQRLYQKNEDPLIHEIRLQQNLYGAMASEFRFVVDNSENKEEAFGKMLMFLQEAGIIPTPSEKWIKRLRTVLAAHIPETEDMKITYMPVGRSLAINHCVSYGSVPRYFVKICRPSKRCLDIIKPLTAVNPHFNRIEAVLPVGLRTSCILLEWEDGSALTLSAENAQQAAQIVKMLHSVTLPRRVRKINIRAEVFRHLLYIILHGVNIPHGKEIIGFLLKNTSLSRKEYALTHMDLHGENFYLNCRKQICLIDYENIRVTDPWRDFTYAVFFHEKQEDPFWYAFLQSYFGGNISDQFWSTMKYYCHLQAVRMMVCSHQRKDLYHIDYVAESIWRNYHQNNRTIPAWFSQMKHGE